jgi:hypothetical protein
MEELHTSDADRRELHALVDHIPAGDLPAARKILRALADPVSQSILAAPLDDEPETEHERAEVEAARKETGTGTNHQESLARIRCVSTFIWTERAKKQLRGSDHEHALEISACPHRLRRER